MNLQVQVEHGTVDKTDNIIWWPTLPVGIFILSFHSCAVVYTLDLEQFIQLETFPSLYPPYTIVSQVCTSLRSNLMLKLTLLCERSCNSCSTCYQEMPTDQLFVYFMKHLSRIREVYITCCLVKPSNGHSPSTAQQAKCKPSSPRWA